MRVCKRCAVFAAAIPGEVGFVGENGAAMGVDGAGGGFAGAGDGLVDVPGVEEARCVGGELETGTDLGGRWGLDEGQGEREGERDGGCYFGEFTGCF